MGRETLTPETGEFVMLSAILPMLGSAVLFLLYLGLAAILVRKYKATGDLGFVWLILATIAWPIVASYAGGQLTLHYLRAHPYKPGVAGMKHPDVFALFNMFQRAVEVLLLIVAVRFFGKTEEGTPSAR